MRKTILSIVMAVVMVLSVFTNAFAFTDSQKVEIRDALNAAGLGSVYNTTVPADIELKMSDEANFVDGPKAVIFKAPEMSVDYKAVLDMQSVKDAFDTYVTVVTTLFSVNYPESYDSLMAEFDNFPVRADFYVTVEIPAGMTIPAELISTQYKGFSEQIPYFFEETSRTESGNVITVAFALRDNVSGNDYVTKKQLYDNFDSYLSEFNLVCENIKVNNPGVYIAKGGVTGTVYLGGTSRETALFRVNFVSEQMEGVHDTEDGLLQGTLTILSGGSGSTRPSGGGVSQGTKEPGKVIVVIDGKEHEYSSGTEATPEGGHKVDLDELKKPEKENAEFEGWYYDEKLTQPAEGEVVIKPGEELKLYPKFVSNFVPDVFEKSDEHFAYVIGYPDGTVRPEDNISREEIATIFYRLMTDEYRDSIASTENDFEDVEADRWSNRAISTMANGGYIQGYEGKFNPEDAITRAEFVTIAARFLETENDAEADFTDIEGHWAKEYIDATSDALWISGYEDNTFRPDNFITRAEAMAIFNRILCRRVDEDGLLDGTVYFPDLSETEWYWFDVLEATNSHKCEKPEGEVYENWTELLPNRDWTKY